jgi:hypothetical protein
MIPICILPQATAFGSSLAAPDDAEPAEEPLAWEPELPEVVPDDAEPEEPEAAEPEADDPDAVDPEPPEPLLDELPQAATVRPTATRSATPSVPRAWILCRPVEPPADSLVCCMFATPSP